MESTQAPFPATHVAMPLSTAQLPVRLRDLLMREVCMDISRAHVEEALNQVEREAEVLRKTRPPFLFLQGKSMRSEFQQRESGAVESLAALAQGLQKITAAQPRLRAWVEDDLETFVRDAHPAYMQGLATHRYPDDWQRALVRFDLRVAGFRAALGIVQAALGVVPPGVLLASHAGAFECLMPARQWAALLDYEITFFNRVADLQRRSLAVGDNTLKRSPEPHFSAQIGNWARMDAEAVRKTMMEFRAKMELAVMDARAVYASEASLAVAGPGVDAGRSHVLPIWETLRGLIRAEVDPDKVEIIVAETEQMVAAAGG